MFVPYQLSQGLREIGAPQRHPALFGVLLRAQEILLETLQLRNAGELPQTGGVAAGRSVSSVCDGEA